MLGSGSALAYQGWGRPSPLPLARGKQKMSQGGSHGVGGLCWLLSDTFLLGVRKQGEEA